MSTGPFPDIPHCATIFTTGCICRVDVLAREAEPVEMVVFGCPQCHRALIATRLPDSGPLEWQGAAYANITDNASLIGAIEQESFRLGLPKPSIKKAEPA